MFVVTTLTSFFFLNWLSQLEPCGGMSVVVGTTEKNFFGIGFTNYCDAVIVADPGKADGSEASQSTCPAVENADELGNGQLQFIVSMTKKTRRSWTLLPAAYCGEDKPMTVHPTFYSYFNPATRFNGCWTIKNGSDFDTLQDLYDARPDAPGEQNPQVCGIVDILPFAST